MGALMGLCDLSSLGNKIKAYSIGAEAMWKHFKVSPNGFYDLESPSNYLL